MRSGSRKAGSLLLFCVLTAAACSSQEAAAGGSGGLSGTGGMGPVLEGLGGQGDTICADGSDGCVSSCAIAPFVWTPGFCNAAGAFTCPADFVRLSSCASNICGQTSVICCDDTTGVIAAPPCKPDGLFDVCPAGSHSTTSGCIPAALGVTDCSRLGGTCGMVGQRCSDNGTHCECTAFQVGVAWECMSPIP